MVRSVLMCGFLGDIVVAVNNRVMGHVVWKDRKQ